MIRILIATGNAHKVEEFQAGFSALGCCVELIAADSLAGLIEDAPTFAGNAALKAAFVQAEALAKDCDYTLGDDSGFIAAALSGHASAEGLPLADFPGVQSNRWITPTHFESLCGRSVTAIDDATRCEALLALLDDNPQRDGCFVSALCLQSVATGQRWEVEGRCLLHIEHHPRGKNGFGYDPIVSPLLAEGRISERRMAELTLDEKNQLSHRGLALQQLIKAPPFLQG